MPIYEYLCSKCGHQFEWLVRGEEKPVCPLCGDARLAKQISVPAAHTAVASPECPARDLGACGMQNCCGSRCGLDS